MVYAEIIPHNLPGPPDYRRNGRPSVLASIVEQTSCRVNINMEQRPKKLLDQVSDAIRRKHYAPKTGESYGKRLPTVLTREEVTRLLGFMSGRP